MLACGEMRPAILVLALGAACIPTPVSPACQEQMNQCLRACPEPPSSAATGYSDDQRSACEKDCHDQAGRCS